MNENTNLNLIFISVVFSVCLIFSLFFISYTYRIETNDIISGRIDEISVTNNTLLLRLSISNNNNRGNNIQIILDQYYYNNSSVQYNYQFILESAFIKPKSQEIFSYSIELQNTSHDKLRNVIYIKYENGELILNGWI